MENPDKKKYEIRIRRGRPMLVNRQILRWREKCKKYGLGVYANLSLAAPGCPRINDQGSLAPDPLPPLPKLFLDDSGANND